MSEGNPGRAIDKPGENRQQKKKRLIGEIRASQEPANLIPSICKIAELFMLDPDEKIAVKMLRKSLAKNVEGVFKACVSLLNDRKAAHCAVICADVAKHAMKEKSFLNLLGASIEKQGRIEEAIAVFTQAIELDLHWPVARFNRGKPRLSLGLAEESIKDFSHVLKGYPDDEAALLNRASAMIRLGQRDSALSDLDRLVMLNHRSVEGLVNKAILLLETSQTRELDDILQLLSSLAPDHPQYIRIKFELAMHHGSFDQAHEYAAAGMRLFPNEDQFAYAMAVVETEFNKDASALKRLDSLVRHQNHELGVKPLLLSARSSEKANRSAEAVNLLLDAYRLDP
ncbi:MAG: tetratricopeptide repeat protein [Candidatus Azotimanducaceae bacterium]